MQRDRIKEDFLGDTKKLKDEGDISTADNLQVCGPYIYIIELYYFFLNPP